MQKRARFRFAHKAVNIRILIALQVLLTAAGYYLCAGKAISEPPVIRMTATAGITKITSRNGDNEFVSNGGFHITMKHQIKPVLSRFVTLNVGFEFSVKHRTTSETIYGLRLTGALDLHLQFSRKRYHTPRRIAR